MLFIAESISHQTVYMGKLDEKFVDGTLSE